MRQEDALRVGQREDGWSGRVTSKTPQHKHESHAGMMLKGGDEGVESGTVVVSLASRGADWGERDDAVMRGRARSDDGT